MDSVIVLTTPRETTANDVKMATMMSRGDQLLRIVQMNAEVIK